MKLAESTAASHYATIVAVAKEWSEYGMDMCFCVYVCVYLPFLFEFDLSPFLFIYFLVFDCDAVGKIFTQQPHGKASGMCIT